MSAGKPFSAWLGCMLWLTGCIDAEPLTPGGLVGSVYLSTPVVGATVQAQFLDERGQVELSAVPVVTDEAGRFSVNLGTVRGRLRLVAFGGQTIDLATGERVPLEAELHAVLFRYHPAYPDEVAVTPLTTLATALGERRFQRGDEEPSYFEAMARAYELLSMHVGGFDLVHTPLHDPGERVVAQDQGSVYHGLVLAALSSLAARIARESNLAPRSLHAGHLLDALVADASGPEARFDGIGASGSLRIGTCPPPLDCTPGGTCTTICDLDANTLRADLATALAFDFLPSAQNGTGWTFENVRPLIEALQRNTDTELFGNTPIDELAGPPPTVRIVPSTMDDESRDLIEFSPAAVPIHTSRATLELAPGTTCPVVYKHTHRLDEPNDNPIRWVFEVLDHRGVAIRPEGGAYRIRLRGGDWLTDWLPANPRASVDGGIEYEAVLLRSDIPELGTTEGTFEIALRGQDALGTETTPALRCWEHVPLTVPLQVANVGEVVGPGSLHAANLDPGNNLAPLLNGVALEQGRGVMELTLRNGTTEPAYVTLTVEQGAATYLKSWQEANAPLSVFRGETDCLGTGACFLSFPPQFPTMIVTDESGVIDELVSGLVVEDLATGEILVPCPGCGPSEYLLAPRPSPGLPREYRVMLVATDLSALAPQPFGAGPQLFFDVPLDPQRLPIPITGRSLGRVRKCFMPHDVDPRRCPGDEEHAHYIALTAASLAMDLLQVIGRTRPGTGIAPRMPLPGNTTLGIPVGLEGGYTWTTSEPIDLPVADP